jgi:hypothetical protein
MNRNKVTEVCKVPKDAHTKAGIAQASKVTGYGLDDEIRFPAGAEILFPARDSSVVQR